MNQLTPDYLFTGDEHYDHNNILKYRDGYVDNPEMVEVQIAKHNELAHKNSITIHHGDFAWKNPEPFLSRLNGSHILLIGNHEPRKKSKLAGFASVKDIYYIKIHGQQIFMSHYAHRVWRNSHHGCWHTYAHSHNQLPGIGKSRDVGVDTNDGYPYTFEQLKGYMDAQEIRGESQHHGPWWEGHWPRQWPDDSETGGG